MGEATRHPGDLPAQLEETLANLAALARSVAGGGPQRELLARFTGVRVYVPRHADVPAVRTACRSAFGAVESWTADLCRHDLLVEIEGAIRAG